MRGRFEVTDLGNGYADGGGWVRFARRGRMSAFGRESPRGREAGQWRGGIGLTTKSAKSVKLLPSKDSTFWETNHETSQSKNIFVGTF